jgi:hypothetical protein
MELNIERGTADAVPTGRAARHHGGMDVTIIVDRDGEYIRARGQSFYTEEFFGDSKEEAVLAYLTGFFTYLALKIDMREVPLAELAEIRPVVTDLL